MVMHGHSPLVERSSVRALRHRLRHPASPSPVSVRSKLVDRRFGTTGPQGRGEAVSGVGLVVGVVLVLLDVRPDGVEVGALAGAAEGDVAGFAVEAVVAEDEGLVVGGALG